jgi:hypothetical protein
LQNPSQMNVIGLNNERCEQKELAGKEKEDFLKD